MPGGWKGLPASFSSGIDAAIFRKGHTYFFKGNQYVRFTGTKLDSGYPVTLPGGWDKPAAKKPVDGNGFKCGCRRPESLKIGIPGIASKNVGGVVPAWVAVSGEAPRTVEGVLTVSKITHTDFPLKP